MHNQDTFAVTENYDWECHTDFVSTSKTLPKQDLVQSNVLGLNWTCRIWSKT